MTAHTVSKNRLLDVDYRWTINGVELSGKVPARVTQAEAAEMLGITTSDMRALKSSKLLFPCGFNPSKRRKNYNTAFYSTQSLVLVMSDANWMDKMQYAISEYNAKNNNRLDKIKSG